MRAALSLLLVAALGGGAAISCSRPPPPRNVSPTAVERNTMPDKQTKLEIARSGKAKLVGSYKLCLSTEGTVASVTLLRSTTFPPYDEKIMNEIRQWRYRPFVVNGKPAPVCTAVTFLYSPAPAPIAPPAPAQLPP